MAGDLKTSFLKSLCVGVIEEDLIFPYPKMKDSERETFKTLVDSFKSWLAPKANDFRKWDVSGQFPPEFIEEMRQFGLFSFCVPEEHGGMGFTNTAYSRALQELSRYDASLAVTAGAHSSIGMKGLLLFGNPEQKAKYLPKLASGEMIASFCLTESGAGSDAAALKTKAVRDGKDWIITGEKIWITNGELASFFTVFAKTDTDSGKMSAFIVTRDMAGVSTGPHEDKMGLRASATNTVVFDNVRVPAENLLGEEGKGFKIAMAILNNGRTGLGGGSVGGMKKLITLASKQAKERKQFGKSISEFGLIKQKLGHMVVECYTAESMVNMLAGLIDSGSEDYSVEAAAVKIYASEALHNTADEALQIAAGNGFMREFPYEQMVRDSRINRIFEGANEILRLYVGLNGLNEGGSQLKEVKKGMEGFLTDPIKGFGVLSNYTKKVVGSRTKLFANTLTKSSPYVKQEAAIFEEKAKVLTIAVDRLILKWGKEIVNKQFATKRVADIMIDLFALGCVLSRVSQAIETKGPEKCIQERQILACLAGQVDGRIRRNYFKIDNNDDEDIKSLADHAFENEGYSWDNI